MLYENKGLWNSDHYSGNPIQRDRLGKTVDAIPDTESILDPGCGNGAFLSLIGSRNGSHKLEGLERLKINSITALRAKPIDR